MTAGEVSHGGEHDAIFTAHIGNAHKRYLAQRDEDGAPLWIIQKERPGSPHKMDAAQGGCWAWWARLEAITAGVNLVRTKSPLFIGRA
jgi:hypothetical protein